ncbi:MAG: GTP 3',8-cyclase MoaA [Candidatus Scalindua sp. AMX11]|nr:MAG: GTP 3',8-cyclase MoaA [Candidatus Scalindua sp.]NOG82532.1 GTP 3',8-cyclase MoaA [Planctomycetota bacterium]RZV93962.1 MAG: GTP 3',8-cyclase MoaA [Candidatus Scalindua sp. SCAELEC01]TDE65582.1 MAG: GTP 3',8-cyclase MoaA [Candidatus Scalindua sp. AMX11]GJQ58167.1 MAG: GTP 3',8-cyclase [Candidatus Scalindua sp.]
MIDKNLRNINYMRISVTDLCNLRCTYCMPVQGANLLRKDEILSFEEILKVVKHGVGLGINKIRLTGGEPLVRKGIETLTKRIAELDGVNDIAMTTNGTFLKKFARTLKENGLSRFNVSLDTLRPDRFDEITRGGSLRHVLDGIEEVLDAGFQGTKINVVVIRGKNDDEIHDFVRYIFERRIELRFIELMASGWKNMVDEERFVPASEIKQQVEKIGELTPVKQRIGGGPATIYKIKGALGSLGFISAVSQPFCDKCNRVRLTSDGMLRSCLLSGGEVNVKEILRSDILDRTDLAEQLTNAFVQVTMMKPVIHSGRNSAVMHQIGG